MKAEVDYITQLLENFIRQKDEKTAREIFNYFYPRLLAYASYLLSSDFAAEDIVEEVFEKLFRNKNELHKIRNLKYYLYRAIKNQCISYIRKVKRFENTAMIDQEGPCHVFVATPEDKYMDHELIDQIIVLSINYLLKEN